MTNSKANKIRALISDIRYELSPGIHTYGNGSVCKVNAARGCGECIDCKQKRLADLVGKELSATFVNLTHQINTVTNSMIDD